MKLPRRFKLWTARREANDWFVRVQLSDGFNRDAFEAWRAADPANAAAYDELIEDLATSAPLADTRMVRTAQLRRASFVERRPGTSYAVAASVAVILLAGAGYGLRETGYWGTPMEVNQGTIYATRVGEVRTITLTDGSRVTLDTDSVLRVTFTSGERTLRLDAGRARFAVAHDEKRAFIVSAGSGRIIAHGTLFDVSIRSTSVNVVLLRGAVEVTAGSTDQLNRPSRQLSPGQQVTFDQTHPVPPPGPARTAELRWTSGMLSFEGARLADAVAEFNRYNRRKIKVATSSVGDLKITGAFRAGDVQRFANAMATSFDLGIVDQPDDGVLLTPRNATTEP
jgi:transmembrane sensor